MTASPSSRPIRRGFFVWLSALCLLSTAAYGQEFPGNQETPAGPADQPPSKSGTSDQATDAETEASDSTPPEGPVSILPGPSVPAPEEKKDAAAAPSPALPFDQAESGVQIGRLKAPAPGAVGILDEASGGFPWTLWDGSDLSLIRRLMARLPAPFQTPVLQDLSRRLLLSAAALPETESLVLGEDPESRGLLRLRIDRLAAGGQLTEIVELLDQVSGYSQGTVLEKRRVNALLLLNNTERACKTAEAAVRRSEDPYWMRLAAYCRAMAGETDSVSRTLDLLAEVRDAEDPAFQAFISQMLLGETGSMPKGVSLRDPSPLVFSMAQTLDVPLPAAVLLTADPMILRAVATAENAAPDMRLAATEQAAMFGAMPLDALTERYAAADFSDKTVEAGLDALSDLEGARANAFLYQRIRQSSDARTRIDYLTAAWNRARQQGQYPLIARVHLTATRAIEPAPNFIPDAGPIVRALLMAGATDRAFEWYETVRRRASAENAEATQAMLSIWPLFHLAAPDTDVTFSRNILHLWWQVQVTGTAAERVRRGRLLFGLLEALDYEVPQEFWTAVLSAPLRVNDPVPAAALWRTIIRAGAAGRLGETVLASLTGLGNNGPGATSLSALSSIIGQWRAVGLNDEARRLAVSAAILRGL